LAFCDAAVSLGFERAGDRLVPLVRQDGRFNGVDSRVGVDGPTASSASMFGLHSTNKRAREIKRVANDTSKHVFTLHGVDERDHPVLRRWLLTEPFVDAKGKRATAEDGARPNRRTRHPEYSQARSMPQSYFGLAREFDGLIALRGPSLMVVSDNSLPRT